MTQYLVEVVIGQEYLLLIEADNESKAHDFARQYTRDGNFPNVSELEQEAGRAIVSVSEFNHPPCSICNEAYLDCVAESVATGELVNTINTLYKQNQNAEVRQHLVQVLDGYLTHVVCPCNTHSRA